MHARPIELGDVGPEVLAELLEVRVLLLDVLAHVTGIEGDPGVVQRRVLEDLLRERHGLRRRLHADAVHPEIDLDVHVHLPLRHLRRRRELSERRRGVERDGELDLMRDVHHPRELRCPDQRVGEEQVVRNVAHDLELARRGAR
jgi:hypothetical protein